ncbi:conjugal transfer protein [Streptomyces sp. NPDC056190]|uniref:conjugal transfer protein n=1 Tax=Streptomyces sp. NPDC056190 TaxID=3345741 RepID=UPI0035DCA64F
MSTAPRTRLSRAQKIVLTAAFVPMVATGVAGGVGTFSNISHTYGQGTALGAVAAGEGATAVLALVLLGLTMLGQSAPLPIRVGLWALPAAASVMAATAGTDPGRTVIYAITPMGMCVSAEGMAFLARRIVVHTDGRDAESERRAAAVVQALAYHRARAANHPDEKVRDKSERTSWKLARKVGQGDHTLGVRLLDVQRDRVTSGADAALGSMFSAPDTNAEESNETERKRSTAELPESTPDPITVSVVRVPDPVPVDHAKPVLPLKPLPPVDPAPLASIARRPVAAESTRPRRATGRVPEVAKSTRPKRTPDQLLAEARKATADWPDAKVTAEGIRREIRTSPANARTLRDTILAERAATAAETA